MTECSQRASRLHVIFPAEWKPGSALGMCPVTGDRCCCVPDGKIHLLPRLAACFRDGRRPERIEHTVSEMLSQRVYGLALGYEDLNDHEQLRQDPVLGTAGGKRDWKQPLAGKSTLNRLELGRAHGPLQEDHLLEKHRRAAGGCVHRVASAMPEQIVLDLDTTDIPLHGHQPERFFHGYYDSYCYLPLYIFCRRSVAVRAARCCQPGRRGRARSRKSSASLANCGNAGRKCTSCCAATPASAAKS